MKNLRAFAPWLMSAALLAGCGGGDPDVPGAGGPSGAPTSRGNFAAIVSFGTSASDLGTYAPATSVTGDGRPPFFGGKFTTNSASGTVWVENLAAQLSTPAAPLLVTPAEIGFNGVSVACPAAATPALAGTCTGYAQGGAMITQRNGIGRDPATGAGALTVPLVMQIDRHLERFGSFSDTDLILVEGGLNDLFVAFAGFAAAAQEIGAEVALGNLTQAEGQAQLFAAQTVAQAALRLAATELGGYVRTKILANGGRYVAVATVPDLRSTPFGRAVGAQSPALQAALSELAQVFNLWLREALENQPVRIVDITDVFDRVVADPAAAGFVNASDPACDAKKIADLTRDPLSGVPRVTDGNPVFCNSTPGSPYNTLAAGASPTTWFFADDVHPSTGGHKLLGRRIVEQLQAFGWI
jgi:outer membrane lipase/esterase